MFESKIGSQVTVQGVFFEWTREQNDELTKLLFSAAKKLNSSSKKVNLRDFFFFCGWWGEVVEN